MTILHRLGSVQLFMLSLERAKICERADRRLKKVCNEQTDELQILVWFDSFVMYIVNLKSKENFNDSNKFW